jgi:hypothetical protein
MIAKNPDSSAWLYCGASNRTSTFPPFGTPPSTRLYAQTLETSHPRSCFLNKGACENGYETSSLERRGQCRFGVYSPPEGQPGGSGAERCDGIGNGRLGRWNAKPGTMGSALKPGDPSSGVGKSAYGRKPGYECLFGRIKTIGEARYDKTEKNV